MRCPKCGYISFDHNQICPKCNKDISDEQAKLNLPTYKSNPPALLGMLVGAGDESNVGFTLDSDAALRRSGMGLDFEEASSMLGSSSIDFGEGDKDLEISLNDDTGEFELPEIGLDAQSGDTADIDLSSEDEDLSLDMDEVSLEDSDDTADDLGFDLGEKVEESGIGDSLDGISPSDSIVLEGMTSEGTEETIEIGSISRKNKKSADGSHSTVELNVSDLKINETGELELNSIPDEIYSPGSLPEENEVTIDKIDVDSEEDMELDISPGGKKDSKNNTGSLELGDLAIDEDESMDLSGLSLNDNETGELNMSDFEENISDEDSSFDSEKTVGFDDSLNIDLENLDLDLDLDDTADKK